MVPMGGTWRPLSLPHSWVRISLMSFHYNLVRQVGPFIVAQFLGAFVGAFWVYSVYWSAINAYDNGVRSVTGPTSTAGIFATYPAVGLIPIGLRFEMATVLLNPKD